MTDLLTRLPPESLQASIIGFTVILAAIGAAIGAHVLIFGIVRRAVQISGSHIQKILMQRLKPPSRWILIAIALSFSAPSISLTPSIRLVTERISGFVLPMLVGWLALACLRAVQDIIVRQTDISAPDNLAARRKRTRVGILSRIGAFTIIFLTACMMLISIPGVRSVGVTLMASAGLAGLAIGAAAQPALKNLIAGMQLAFSEPIRIDDVVIIAGEWGRIEEIRLTYVVVRVWDERRLIVPVSKFLEETFQNWTREGSQLLGTAFVYVDPVANVERIRDKLNDILGSHPLWDQRVAGLQVTDIKPEVMELRALISAADAGKAFDLRCDVREELMQFISESMPEALPKRRAEMQIRPLPHPSGA